MALNNHATTVSNKDYLGEDLASSNMAFNRLIQTTEENEFRSFANLPNPPETIALGKYNRENQALN